MSNYSPPFSGDDIQNRYKVKRLVKSAENYRAWKNPYISNELKDFINALLKFNPKERLGYRSWREIKEHPFFTVGDFDWSALADMSMPSPLQPIIDRHPIHS